MRQRGGPADRRPAGCALRLRGPSDPGRRPARAGEALGRPAPGRVRGLSASASLSAMREIRGVITAMATPFDAGGGVDEGAARRLARHLVEHGSHGVVVAGTTGESPTLSDDEKLSLLAAVLEEIGAEATVICGTGSNDTAHSVELTRAAAEAGAHGALVVTPYYNKPNRAGLEAHFDRGRRRGARAADRPLQHPLASGRQHRPRASRQSWRRIENVVAVKQANDEDLGRSGLGHPRRQRRRLPARPWSSGASEGSSSPPIWSGRRCGRSGRRRRPGRRERAQAIEAELRPVWRRSP